MFPTGYELPEIRAPRVSLRWLLDRDVDDLFRIYSDAEAMKYWSSLPMTDRGEAEALVASVREFFEAQTLLQWGVWHRDDSKTIGTVTLASLDLRNLRAEIGFMLSRDRWGQGLMSEALGALLDYAFGELELERIEADVDPRNEASLRLLERLGFVREGYLRERWRVGGGVQDTVMLGLLRREWGGAASASKKS